MKRSSILERLYELNADDSSDKKSISKLMYDVIHNKVSTEDAESQLRVIDPFYIRYEFLQNLKGKPIYKNISEFRKGNLSNIEIMKMISSLITQILIQIEHNPEITAKSLQIDVLLSILKDYSENPSNIDFDRINSLLDNYGWKDQSDDN